ncbi:MAG TPA: hypothetical protein DCR87_06420 [Acidobacteria bacterium]|nr:hypothetical protein [Acidobacteriota bacterium]
MLFIAVGLRKPPLSLRETLIVISLEQVNFYLPVGPVSLISQKNLWPSTNLIIFIVVSPGP